MKKYLSPKTMLDLEKLFEEKGWEIDESLDIKKSLYKRYCELLKFIDLEEQNLMIELSRRFEQIEMKDYIEFFLMSFFDVGLDLLASKEKIIFAPLIRPFIEIDISKKKIATPPIKSSQFLFYMLQGHDLRWLDHSSKFEFFQTIKDIKENYIQDRTLLILIDDFIGSGKTAINCIENIKKEFAAEVEKEVNINDICVMTIVAQNEGIQNIKDNLGINVYCDKIRKKGITDFFEPKISAEKMDLMKNIEKKLSCPKDYSLGYEETEALVTFMNKTPNNTFPAYWHETKSKIAPFPRYKIYK
jgi:hypothetical protein